MENLPLFLKTLRDGQGISQAALAEKIGVSQSAIAQFEKMKATLSVSHVIRLAPILNVNPDYLQKGIGNPFKQNIKQKTIKMFFPEDPLGRIDINLVKIIMDANIYTELFFLRPGYINPRSIAKVGGTVKKKLYQWQRQRSINTMLCGLYVCDGDNNTFLFKRKDNRLFDNEELMKCFVQTTERNEHKFYSLETINLGLPECIEIINWHDSSFEKLFEAIPRSKFLNDRTFLIRLLNYIWSRKELLKDSTTYEKVMNITITMCDDNIRRLSAALVPRIVKVVEEIFYKSGKD